MHTKMHPETGLFFVPVKCNTRAQIALHPRGLQDTPGPPPFVRSEKQTPSTWCTRHATTVRFALDLADGASENCQTVDRYFGKTEETRPEARARSTEFSGKHPKTRPCDTSAGKKQKPLSYPPGE